MYNLRLGVKTTGAVTDFEAEAVAGACTRACTGDGAGAWAWVGHGSESWGWGRLESTASMSVRWGSAIFLSFWRTELRRRIKTSFTVVVSRLAALAVGLSIFQKPPLSFAVFAGSCRRSAYLQTTPTFLLHLTVDKMGSWDYFSLKFWDIFICSLATAAYDKILLLLRRQGVYKHMTLHP